MQKASRLTRHVVNSTSSTHRVSAARGHALPHLHRWRRKTPSPAALTILCVAFIGAVVWTTISAAFSVQASSRRSPLLRHLSPTRSRIGMRFFGLAPSNTGDASGLVTAADALISSNSTSAAAVNSSSSMSADAGDSRNSSSSAVDVTTNDSSISGSKSDNKIDGDDLEVGLELQGKVIRTALFGLIVDVGLSDPGVVPNSAISLTGRPDNRSQAEEVEPGDDVRVWVAGRNVANQLLLSMLEGWVLSSDGKRVVPDLSELLLNPSQWFDGKVLDIDLMGAFVAIRGPGGKPEVRGLVHHSQMQEGFVDHPSALLKQGQNVRVRAVKADLQTGELHLTMLDEAAESRQRSQSKNLSSFVGVNSSEWLNATVVDFLPPKGISVTLAAPGTSSKRRFLIPNPLLDRCFRHDYSEVWRMGEEVAVRVTDVDLESDKLSLTMLDASGRAREDPLPVFQNLAEDMWLNATVKRLASYGAFVAVDAPVAGNGSRVITAEGLVHISAIGEARIDLPSDVLEVGQDVRVRRVRNQDSDNRDRLSFSMLDRDAGKGKGKGKSEAPPKPSAAVKAAPKKSAAAALLKGLKSGEVAQIVDSMESTTVAEDLEKEGDFTAWLEISPLDWLNGTVARVTEYGVFVNIAPPSGAAQRSGLVHISNMPRPVRLKLEGFKVNDVVKVRLVSIDEATKRLTFTMLEDDEDEDEAEDGDEDAKQPKPAASNAKQSKAPEPTPALESAPPQLSPLPPREAPATQIADDRRMDRREEDDFEGSKVLKKAKLLTCLKLLLDQGYDSVELLKDLDDAEWAEMREECKLRPGDVAKLRRAVGRNT